MVDTASYWQIRHKQSPTRNVWVSGVAGLCDIPEDAMKLAVGVNEIKAEDAVNWDIIRCASWDDLRERQRIVKLGS